MLKTEDTFRVFMEVNQEKTTHEVKLDERDLSLARVQDIVGIAFETYENATSIVFTVVRVTHTTEERLSDDEQTTGSRASDRQGRASPEHDEVSDKDQVEGLFEEETPDILPSVDRRDG